MHDQNPPIASTSSSSLLPPSFFATQLENRCLLELSGEDVTGFLQGIFTSDLRGLLPHTAQYSALLTPQGKVLHTVFLYRIQDNGPVQNILIEAEKSSLDSLLQKISLYKLRRPLTLSNKHDWGVVASPQNVPIPHDDPSGILWFQDPRQIPGLGRRILGPKTFLSHFPNHPEGYLSHLRYNGLVEEDSVIGLGRFFPHELNLDVLGALSFQKGCYVGQEVVSRIQHRHATKTRLFPIVLNDSIRSTNWPESSELFEGERLAGTVLTADGPVRVAMIRLSALGHLLFLAPSIDAQAVRVHLPDVLKGVVSEPEQQSSKES